MNRCITSFRSQTFVSLLLSLLLHFLEAFVSLLASLLLPSSQLHHFSMAVGLTSYSPTQPLLQEEILHPQPLQTSSHRHLHPEPHAHRSQTRPQSPPMRAIQQSFEVKPSAFVAKRYGRWLRVAEYSVAGALEYTASYECHYLVMVDWWICL